MKNVSTLQANFKWLFTGFLLIFMLQQATATVANTASNSLPFPQKEHTFLGKMKQKVVAKAFRFSPKVQKIMNGEKTGKKAGDIALAAAGLSVVGFLAFLTMGTVGLGIFLVGGVVALIAGIIAVNKSGASKNTKIKGIIGILIGGTVSLLILVGLLFWLAWSQSE